MMYIPISSSHTTQPQATTPYRGTNVDAESGADLVPVLYYYYIADGAFGTRRLGQP